jgi:hypothetical protein
MVSNPGPFTGQFDPSLSPVVRICRWAAEACTGSDLVFVSGSGQEHIKVATDAYSLVWQSTSTLELGGVYRVRVYDSESATIPLGFADLLVVTKSADASTTRAPGASSVPGVINVVKGSPFNIKFRVETVVGPGGVAPTAVNDGPAAGSAPGDAYHGTFNTTFDLAAPALLSNDNLGTPAALIASFGIISNGLTETVTEHAAGTTASLGTGGSLRVNADGSVSLTPPTGFTGYVVFLYRLSNAVGNSDATATIGIGRRAATSNDTYAPALIGNVPINTATSTQFSVLTNDPADGMSAALVSATNGTATVASDGKFSFKPDVGFSGAASITYRATNGFGDAPATATVSLTVGAPIWFVNAGAGTNGDGRFGTPFNCLVGTGCFDPAATDAANETVFLYSGNYAGPLTLLAGQRLVGQGASSPLGAIAGLTWPSDAGPEPTMSGSAPTITNGLTVATGNTLRGFGLGNASGAALVGASFGTLTVSEVGINTTGQALDLANGTPSGSLSGVTSTGGTHNISLSNLAGTLSLGSGALSAATGDGFVVSGGSGVISYAGSVSNSAALSVHVTGRTGGSLTLSGDINPGAPAAGVDVSSNNGGASVTFGGGTKRIASGTGVGVNIANNAGAAVSFTGGGLSVTSTTGTAVLATGGGTVTVTGSNNTAASTGGVALKVDNTIIGPAGLTFRSISADGGSNGIVLVSTGSNGGLTVTGDGSTSGSGGTIQNMTGGDGSTDGTGVHLDRTTGTSLGYMNLSNHTNYAVRGLSASNFSLNRVRITGTNGDNDAAGEGSVVLTELSGTNSITRSFISGGVKDNVHVENTSATLTSLSLSQDSVQDNSSSTGNYGVAILARSSAQMTVSVGSSFFKGNRAQALRADAGATAAIAITASGNTFVAGAPNQGTRGIDLTATADAQVTYDVDANRVGTDGVTNQPLSNTGINVFADNRSTMTGKVRNNTIWNAGLGISGQGIRVFVNDTANIRANVSGNTIANVGLDNGLLVEASGADTQVPPAGTGTVDIGLSGNTVNVLSVALDAMRIQSRHNNRVCARISGNASTETAGGFFGLFVRAVNASQFRIEGLTGTAGPYLEAQNPGVTDGVADNGGTFISVPANTCNVPQ